MIDLPHHKAKIEINKIVDRICREWGIPRPRIFFDKILDNTLDNTIAGQAKTVFSIKGIPFFGLKLFRKWKVQYTELYFNLEYMSSENWQFMTTNTVPHEIGHLIVDRIYGPGHGGHGSEWLGVMEILGAPATEFHPMLLSSEV